MNNPAQQIFNFFLHDEKEPPIKIRLTQDISIIWEFQIISEDHCIVDNVELTGFVLGPQNNKNLHWTSSCQVGTASAAL